MKIQLQLNHGRGIDNLLAKSAYVLAEVAVQLLLGSPPQPSGCARG